MTPTASARPRAGSARSSTSCSAATSSTSRSASTRPWWRWSGSSRRSSPTCWRPGCWTCPARRCSGSSAPGAGRRSTTASSGAWSASWRRRPATSAPATAPRPCSAATCPAWSGPARTSPRAGCVTSAPSGCAGASPGRRSPRWRALRRAAAPLARRAPAGMPLTKIGSQVPYSSALEAAADRDRYEQSVRVLEEDGRSVPIAKIPQLAAADPRRPRPLRRPRLPAQRRRRPGRPGPRRPPRPARPGPASSAG